MKQFNPSCCLSTKWTTNLLKIYKWVLVTLLMKWKYQTLPWIILFLSLILFYTAFQYRCSSDKAAFYCMFQSTERYYQPMWFQLHLMPIAPICVSIALNTLLDSVFESAYSTLLKFLIIPQILNSKTTVDLLPGPKGISFHYFPQWRACYTEWSKSERWISYTNTHTHTHTHTHIWNLERWYWWIYLQDSSGETDIENRFKDMGKGEERVRYMERVTCNLTFSSVQFSSVAQSCPTLCNPMNRSTPGLPVHHQLPEFTQTSVHRNRM